MGLIWLRKNKIAMVVSSSDDGVDEEHGADIGSDADDSEEERSLLEVAGAPIGREDHVKHEEVVERQHPFQHIAAHPHVCLMLAVVPVDVTCKTAGHEDPKDTIHDSPGHCQQRARA